MLMAKTLVEKLVKYIAIERRYDYPRVVIEESSSDGGNFTTKLYRVTLAADNRPELKLFTKVVVFSQRLREQIFGNIFERELWFHTDLARQFDRIQDKHAVRGRDRFLVPNLYGCNPNYTEETFVFEDMSVYGFKTPHKLQVLDWEYASKAVEELAKFHALSIAYNQEDPGQFAKTIKHIYEQPLKHITMENLKKRMIDRAMEVVKEENKDKYYKFVTENWLVGESEIDKSPFYKPLLCPVVTHGDFKTNNLMFRRCPDGTLEVILVDFQIMAIGNVISDLLYLIFTGTDRDFRKKHFQQLLDHYYDKLRKALEKLGVDCDTVYPRRFFDDELKTVLPYGLIAATQILPVMLVEEAEVPEVEADMEITDIVSKPRPEYAVRMNEVVNEFVEWGIL